jgi:hypothetical protein
MKYVQGDIWELARELDAWVVIPTNTTIRRDGKAVMGAGLAKEAADRVPHLQEKLSTHIARFRERLYVDKPVICLATKRDWRQPSRLEWVEHGCFELVELARVLASVGDHRPILVPKLGCGLGGLNWERQVRPVVDMILEGDRFVLVSQ